MRWYAVGLLAVTIAGCGSNLRPEGAVITGWERTQAFGGDNISTAAQSGAYTGQAIVAAPVLPFMAFGAAFDLDLVLVSKHPNWDMHEYARMSTPEGPLWLALEARTGTLDQYITADLPNIDAVMPELPLERKATPFTIQDRSSSDEIDVEISYENIDNQKVDVVFQGDAPYRWQKKRNGNTMGHAKNQALAVVDIPHRESAFKAKISFDDKNEKIAKIAVVPFQFAMEQVQGGLAISSFYTKLGDYVPFESTMAAVVVHPPMLDAPEPEPVPEPAKPDPLSKAMDNGEASLQACYTASAEANPELAGQLVLSWTVTDGAAAEFNTVLDTVGDEALATCVTEAMAGWSWPAAITGENGFPLKFEKGVGLVLHPEAVPEGDEASEVGGDEVAPEEGVDEGLPEAGESLPEAEEALPESEEGEGDDLVDEEPDAEALVEAAPAPAPAGPRLADFSTFTKMPSGNEVEQKWNVEHKGNRVIVSQEAELRTLNYEYLVYHDSLELAAVSVVQYGRPIPTMSMQLSPALPDLRKPFNGRHASQYVIDVNGQQGYATGSIEAWWTESGPKVKVTPEAPKWTEDRSMVTTIQYADGNASVHIERIGE